MSDAKFAATAVAQPVENTEPCNTKCPSQWQWSDRFFWSAAIVQTIVIVMYFIFFDDDCNQYGTGLLTLPFALLFLIVGAILFSMFLPEFAYSAAALSLMAIAFTVEFTILFRWFWGSVLEDNYVRDFYVNSTDIITGLYTAFAVLISFGALFGKLSPLRLLFLALFQTFFTTLSFYVVSYIFWAVDIGFTLSGHIFAPIFGIAVGYLIRTSSQFTEAEVGRFRRTDLPNVFATVGTLFMIALFPFWNIAFVFEQGSIGNATNLLFSSFLALAGSTIITFAASRFIRGNGKFSIEDVQNGSIAGAIAMSTQFGTHASPYAAVLTGIIAGLLVVFSYQYVTPILEGAGIHDTRRVFSVHFVPALFGAYLWAASEGERSGNDTPIFTVNAGSTVVGTNDNRAAAVLYSIVISIVIAAASGLVTGVLLNLSFFDEEEEEAFTDQVHFKKED